MLTGPIKELSENATKLGLFEALIDLYKKYGFGEELKAGMELTVERMEKLSIPFYGEGAAESEDEDKT